MDQLDITNDYLVALFRKTLAERFQVEQDKAVAMFKEQLDTDELRAMVRAQIVAAHGGALH